MSELIDLSQDWELGWVPEKELNRWWQRFGDWEVRDGALVGSTSASAQIFANLEVAQGHAWESIVRIETPETILSVVVCFSTERNAYYQILFIPGSQVRAYYIISDGLDGELLSACGPEIQAGQEYHISVKVLQDEVHVFVNEDEIGAFPREGLAGQMPGFMVGKGQATIREVQLLDLESDEILFRDDFSADSLRRRAPVELSDLQPDAWIPARVPGTVQTALLEAGKIEDPYYGYNGPKQKWVDKQRWVYKKTFTVPAHCLEKNLELVFEGLDYHGYAWLNGELLGYHEGMQRTWRIDITQRVRREESNELVVCLLPCPTPVHSNVKPYIFQRWHFNMDILTIGIWRPVKLRASESIALRDPQVVTRSLGDEGAMVDVQFTIVSNTMYPFKLTGKVCITPPDETGDVIEHEFSSGYFTGAQRRRLEFLVTDPQLWWPNGMGEQSLYRLEIRAQVVEPIKGPEPSGTDSLELTFGIRTLEMRPAPEGSWKYDWVFVVNGEPFFAKGANWMPIDQMLRLEPERYEHILQRAKDSNINMLRPWGGGLLETDEFYDVCDRMGICVWQEFMFANGYFHAMDYDVLRDTVVENVKRLRNRPSLFMWCGGNEFDPDCAENKAVIDLVENLCRQLDPTRDFHRASPYGGDSHSYQVNWMDGANYTYFTRDLSAGITEFSMASPPCLESLRQIIPEEELESWPPAGPAPLEEFDLKGWNPAYRTRESAFSMHDAHLSRALAIMIPFISDSGIPSNWEEFIEYAQTGQGMLTRFGIDFWRSRWPYCTTTMSWVFNVIWPSSMTWEYVDWFGVPKASYYDHKRAYEPIHVGAIFEELFSAPGGEFQASLFVANDTRKSYRDALVQVRLYDITLNKISENQSRVTAQAGRSTPAGFFRWRVPKSASDQVLFLCVELVDGASGDLLSRSVYTPRVGTPAMKMPYFKEGPWICEVRNTATELVAECAEGWHESKEGRTARIEIRNSGDKPAYRLRIACPSKDHELRYSCNHFWLEAGEMRDVTLHTKGEAPDSVTVAAWNSPKQDLLLPGA